MTLLVNEIFHSISGECSPAEQGRMTCFIRLYGCNLIIKGDPCPYCDTIQTDVFPMTVQEIYSRIGECPYVCITGGEPLLQKEAVIDLVEFLADNGKTVWVETNGTFPIEGLMSSIVMDYKLSHESEMVIDRFCQLGCFDYIKFVISSVQEMKRAIAVHKELLDLGCEANFAYSPNFSAKFKSEQFKNITEMVFQYLQESKLDAILNIQIHKLINLK